MKPSPKDPRVGRALTDVVHRHVLRGALLTIVAAVTILTA